MTQQQREDAIKQVEGQLKCGYVDFSGCFDSDELEIIKEAISLLKAVDKFNSIGCTSFWFAPGQEKPIKVAFDDTEAISEEDKSNMNNDGCKFFPERDMVPDNKEIIKMWLESEAKE